MFVGKKKSKKPQGVQKNTSSVAVDPVEKRRLDRARKLCQETIKYAHRLPHKMNAFAEGLDVDDVRAKRRIEAVVGMLDEAKAVADSLCLDVPDTYDFDEEWLTQNLISISGYDSKERYQYNLLAASLWMLDQLREVWEFHSASKVFPRDSCLYDEIDIPEIWDVSHDYDSIMGMLWTIQHRNDDCVGIEEKQKKKKKDKSLKRYYLDDYTVANLHRQDVQSRRNFEYILSKIPQERIDESVKLFEDTFWDVARRIFKSQMVCVRDVEELERREKALNEISQSLVTELKNLNSTSEMGAVPAPVLAARKPYVDAVGRTIEREKREADLWRRVREVSSDVEKLEQERENLEVQISAVRSELGILLMNTKRGRQDFYGPEVTEIWEDFRIEDPYALSFALLYLIEQNSELPWIYGVTTHMMSLCASVLPWRYDSYNIEEDEYWRHYDSETGEPVPAVAKNLPKRIKVPELEDWYSMQYENFTEEDPLCRECINLAQLMYKLTGGIMPRNLTRYEGALEVLDNYGISGKRTVHPLMYCMTMLGECRTQTRVLLLSEPPMKEEPREETKDQETSVEELRKQLGQLQRENQQLRDTAYVTGREARDLRKKLEAVEESVRAERQELVDLRELVFNHQEEVCESREEAPAIEFPYKVRQRIVVFGGHDSWAKEIKPRLPGVRFVDRGMLPNAEMIRQADVVWIQANALPHKFYYKIIDEVRKYRIPVRYFSYNSPLKCAEQLANEDMEGN